MVMGENEWRILPSNASAGADAVNAMMTDGKPRKKFAGEQQITSAILSLTNKTSPKSSSSVPVAPVASPAFRDFSAAGRCR